MRILVTGSSSGIGEAVFRKMEEPYDPITGFQTHKVFGTWATQTPRADMSSGRFQWDVRREAPVMLEKEIAIGMDAVVHCVGVNKLGPYGSMNLTQFKEVMDVNVYGTANLLNLLAKHSANTDRQCTVVIVGSVAGHVPMRNSAAYNASKAAQAMLVRQAAREFGKRMSVIGVQPSYIPGTKMSNYVKKTVQDITGQDDKAFDDYQLKISPVGRYARMDEVVETIRWLITDAPAQALTGQFLNPSCGG